MDLVKQEKLHGKLLTFKLPSGHEVTIREQNGEDDEILSNMSSVEAGKSYDMFLRSIIISHSKFRGKPTEEEVEEMPQRDRLVITVTSRIFSLGHLINFEYQWADRKTPDKYTDDLEDYIWDYSKEFPTEGDDDYKETRIPPYLVDPYKPIEFQTKSGKLLRYIMSNGKSEKYLTTLTKDKASKNSEIKSRFLELFVEGPNEWMIVENFQKFSAREMMEIRSRIETSDKPSHLLSNVTHPESDGVESYVDLMNLVDFFYPMEDL